MTNLRTVRMTIHTNSLQPQTSIEQGGPRRRLTWEAQCRRTIAELRVPSGVRPSIRVAAGRRAQSSRPLARVAGVLAVAALCGLGVVAFAWFDMADICRAWADRLGCTFDTAIYVKPALAVLAVATAAFLPALLRGLRR